MNQGRPGAFSEPVAVDEAGRGVWDAVKEQLASQHEVGDDATLESYSTQGVGSGTNYKFLVSHGMCPHEHVPHIAVIKLHRPPGDDSVVEIVSVDKM